MTSYNSPKITHVRKEQNQKSKAKLSDPKSVLETVVLCLPTPWHDQKNLETDMNPIFYAGSVSMNHEGRKQCLVGVLNTKNWGENMTDLRPVHFCFENNFQPRAIFKLCNNLVSQGPAKGEWAMAKAWDQDSRGLLQRWVPTL